jgi:hypothetical protein
MNVKLFLLVNANSSWLNNVSAFLPTMTKLPKDKSWLASHAGILLYWRTILANSEQGLVTNTIFQTLLANKKQEKIYTRTPSTFLSQPYLAWTSRIYRQFLKDNFKKPATALTL